MMVSSTKEVIFPLTKWAASTKNQAAPVNHLEKALTKMTKGTLVYNLVELTQGPLLLRENDILSRAW